MQKNQENSRIELSNSDYPVFARYLPNMCPVSVKTFAPYVLLTMVLVELKLSLVA